MAPLPAWQTPLQSRLSLQLVRHWKSCLAKGRTHRKRFGCSSSFHEVPWDLLFCQFDETCCFGKGAPRRPAAMGCRKILSCAQQGPASSRLSGQAVHREGITRNYSFPFSSNHHRPRFARSLSKIEGCWKWSSHSPIFDPTFAADLVMSLLILSAMRGQVLSYPI